MAFAPFKYDSIWDMINLRDGGIAIYGAVIGAAVFGGLGSLPGAIVGSVLLGIMEIFVASFNSNLRDLFVYGLLILVLVIKPSGLMGKVVEDKA